MLLYSYHIGTVLPVWLSFRKKSIKPPSVASFSYLDALLEIKIQYFAGEESEGLELKRGIVSVADGTAKGIGHFIAASVCHGGPRPGFLEPWIYKYIACRLQEVLKDLRQTLSTGSLYCDLYKKVSHAINID